MPWHDFSNDLECKIRGSSYGRHAEMVWQVLYTVMRNRVLCTCRLLMIVNLNLPRIVYNIMFT